MEILRQYADKNGYNYQELLADFYSSPRQEQDMFLAQMGGQMAAPQPDESAMMQQEQGGQDQIMQIIQMFAELTGEDPEAIVQQIQQLPPEQQQAAIQEMVAAIQQAQQQQQAQYGGRYGVKKKANIPVSSLGYYEHDPRQTPQLIVPSGDITMNGIDFPIRASNADTGEFLANMQPGQEYSFNARNVLEEPIYAQDGYYDRAISRPEYKEYLSLKSNQKLGYGNLARLQELAKIYENPNFLKAQKNALKKVKTPTVTSVKKVVAKPANSFTKTDLKVLAKSISNAPATSAASVPLSDISNYGKPVKINYPHSVLPNPPVTNLENYGTKVNIKDLQHYDKILQAKKEQAIKAGIKNVKSNSKFYGDTLSDEAVDALARGDKSLATKIKNLKGVSIDKLKAILPSSNLKSLSKLTPTVIKGMGLTAVVYDLFNSVNDFNNLEQKPEDYILTDRGVEPRNGRVTPKLATFQDYKNSWIRDINKIDNALNLNYIDDSTVERKYPKATEGTYEAPAEPSKNITVQGSNKNYNLTWDRDNKADGSSLYNDSEGNRWMKSKDGSVKIIHKGNSSSSVGSPRNSLAPVTQRQRVGSKYLPVKSDKNSWVGDWEKFLVGQGILDGDKTYSVNDIDDTVAEYVKNNPEFYKDNKYIGQKDFGSLLKDGIYGKVHESVRPPSGLSTTSDRWKLPEDIEKSDSITTRPTRFDKDPITGRIPATGGVAPKAIKSPDESVVKPKGQQFKFNTRNLLQGLVAQANVVKAFQPIALPFRQHISLEAPQAKMIDHNAVIAPVMQAFEQTVGNINPNSTTGMAFKANLFGKLTETLPAIINDVNIKNQEIYHSNQVASANARNQEQQFNINADKLAYQDQLQSYANRDAGIMRSLTDLSNLETSILEKNAAIDGYKIENPFINENTSWLDGLFGNRTLEIDPEYRKIQKKNIFLEDAKPKVKPKKS